MLIFSARQIQDRALLQMPPAVALGLKNLYSARRQAMLVSLASLCAIIAHHARHDKCLSSARLSLILTISTVLGPDFAAERATLMTLA